MSSLKGKSSGKVVDFSSAKIGFIGAGKITESLINGLVNYGKVEATRLHVASPTKKNLERLKQLYTGLHISTINKDIFAKYACDIVFIAVHGSVIRNLPPREMLTGSRPGFLTFTEISIKKPLYVLSLVSGFDCKAIRECLLNPENPNKDDLKVIRIVVNTSCAYGLGLCAVPFQPNRQKMPEIVYDLMSSVAKLEYVPESQMDASCALCGAGLAFSYYFINAMADGAFKMGLPRDMAERFAAKTMNCAVQTILESDKHPNELKDDVCGPAGPAIYGIHVLDKADCQSGVSAAVEAAYKRAAELAKGGDGS